MLIGKAVLLMPFQQPLPQLWPLLLRHLATALNFQLMEYPQEGTMANSSPYASRPPSRGAEGQSAALTLAIHTMVIVTMRMMAEDVSVTAVKLTPQDATFLGLVSMLLLDCVEQHYNHHLGGVLVMLTACLAQLCGYQSWKRLHEPDMQAAFVAGMFLYSSFTTMHACRCIQQKQRPAWTGKYITYSVAAGRTSLEQQHFRIYCITWQSRKQASTLCLQSLRCNAFGAVQSCSMEAAAIPVLTLQTCRAGLWCHALAAGF